MRRLAVDVCARFVVGRRRVAARGLASSPQWLDDHAIDTILTGSYVDTVYGGAGDDVIRTGAGGDWINPGPGRDIVDGGKGDDHVIANDGQRDVIDCGPTTTARASTGSTSCATASTSRSHPRRRDSLHVRARMRTDR